MTRFGLRLAPFAALLALIGCSLRISPPPTPTWEVVPTFLVTASPTPTGLPSGTPDGAFTTTLDADWLSPTAPVILPTLTATPTLPPGVTPSLTPSPSAIPTPEIYATIAAAPLDCQGEMTERASVNFDQGMGELTPEEAFESSWLGEPPGQVADSR